MEEHPNGVLTVSQPAATGISASSPKDLLFIDANQYLDLYRMDEGKLLLGTLNDLREYIFITDQIVNEVHRRKLQVAAGFLTDKKLTFKGISIPDHFLNSGDERVSEIRDRLNSISDQFKGAVERIKDLGSDLVEQVAQSKDEVSNALEAIFSKAVKDTDELPNARLRKERGNPPGKKNDPLGDQLSWEQLLSKCCDKKPRLWIITRDSDYTTKHEEALFLNAFLYKELVQIYESEPEIYCFDNLTKGLEHFVTTTKIRAKLPDANEAEKIRKEQESLPPFLSFLSGDSDISTYVAIRNNFEQQESMRMAAIRAQLANESDAIFPPIKKNSK